MNNLLIITQSN